MTRTRFTLCLTQMVEEIGTIEIEADTPAQALAEARLLDLYTQCDNWGPGDDASKVRIYAIQDQNGETVWND